MGKKWLKWLIGIKIAAGVAYLCFTHYPAEEILPRDNIEVIAEQQAYYEQMDYFAADIFNETKSNIVDILDDAKNTVGDWFERTGDTIRQLYEDNKADLE